MPPPTLANKAIHSAPKEKPARVSKMISIFGASPALSSKKINIEDNPKTANPATPNPITVPPLNATFIALGKLVFAASAVLTFAFVAILIPIFPAKAEKTAPITNETTINIPAGIKLVADNAPKAAPAINTNTANILYSAFKNANAPLAIYPDSFVIFSFPAGCLLTHDDRNNIYSNPTTPKAGKM